MIELKDISKNFRDGSNLNAVLNNVSLNINDNDYITIKGESGSGKSTLLNILSLLMSPTSGEVVFDGSRIDFNKERELIKLRGEKLGLVFQSANLISCMDPIENIILASRTKNNSVLIKKAKSLMEQVGLSSKYKTNIRSLSGGEAQRIAIVRALINNPKYLFCDEPTGALDHQNSVKIIELLEEIYKENDCTLVIVTHEIDIWNRGKMKLSIKEGKIYEME